MAHVYFVRHGQTVWNTEQKICGVTDSPLTPLGHEQARQLGQEILRQGLKIDQILCSPLSRARDTAQEISRILGVPVREEPLLLEQNFGKWEGTPRGGAGFQADKRNFAVDFDGGESMMRVCQRIYNLLDRLKAQPDTVYLLVAHNGISRSVNSYFYSMSNEEYATFGLRNCEIRRYDF